MKKQGRPRKPASERKDATLRVRMTNDEKGLIEKAADGKPSEWSRDVLLRAAKRK